MRVLFILCNVAFVVRVEMRQIVDLGPGANLEVLPG